MADTTFSAGTVVTSSWLNDVNAAVYKIAANPIVNTFLSFVFGRSELEIANNITPTVYAYPRGDIRRYGATYGGTAAVITPAVQAAINSGHETYTPNGTWLINDTLNVKTGTSLRFESRNAVWSCNMTKPLIQGVDGTTTRHYHVSIWGGTLYGTTRANANSVAIDFKSISMAKVFGTFINEFQTAVKNGGTSSQGAFYNEFHGVDISGFVTGYDNGTLGNATKIIGGRLNDGVTHVRENDNTGTFLSGTSLETFTGQAVLVADTAATQGHQYYPDRVENGPLGFDIRAAAQFTKFDAPLMISVATKYTDAATTKDTNGRTDDGEFWKSGTPLKKILRVQVVKDIPALAATTYRQEQFTVPGFVAGDSVYVTLPSTWPGLNAGTCIDGGTGLVYVPLYNNTGSSIDPASATFTFTIMKF